MSAIAEVREPDDEHNIPPLMRQPTTSAIRAPHSGHHTPSSTIPNLEGSLDKERDSYCALGAPDEHTSPRQSFLKRQRLAFGTCPPIFFAIVQLLMLVYFLDLYLTLPRESSSKLPRISPQYSIWPYISSIAALNPTAFKFFAFLIVLFFCATFVVGLVIALHTRPGYWLRRLLVVLSLAWSAMFIWLVFVGNDVTSNRHLYVVSVKVIAGLAIKTVAYFASRQMRKHYPALKSDRVTTISHRWKQFILPCAFAVAILANIGTYVCVNETEIQTPGTSCYIVIAIAAIADWTDALVDMSFVLNLAYDIYHHDHLEAARGVDAEVVRNIQRHLSIGEV